MNLKHPLSLLALIIPCLILAGSALCATDGHYYGIVEFIGGGDVVVKTTEHSTGHWKVTVNTTVEGSIVKFDWVYVEMGKGVNVALLRFEERPATQVGVVESIDGGVVAVHSGSGTERWNIVETTLGEKLHLAVGDEISVRVYGNHNLARIKVLKRGPKQPTPVPG